MKNLNLRMPILLHRRLKLHCAKTGETMTSLILRSIRATLATEEQQTERTQS